MNFKVEWTGSYPALCYGEWVISYKGIKLNVPNNVKGKDMGTMGQYDSWYFDDDWSDVWESYLNGEEFNQWILGNESWIKEMLLDSNIEYSIELAEELFYEIQSQDWRHGSCGGCI